MGNYIRNKFGCNILKIYINLPIGSMAAVPDLFCARLGLFLLFIGRRLK